MSKQKTNKKSNQISPEKYIRQRARNLPIYKCWINKEWESTRVATIFVSRQHSSGNLTFCVYMVDLLCMGVKNTIYTYNVPEEEMQQIHKKASKEEWVFDEIPYQLAHNIIYAGVEYAAEYGFNPVPDFTRVTQYMLEEDNDAIPLIDIPCGDENGNPIYINAGMESPAKEKQILKRLDETAGEGNYTFRHLDDNGDNEYAQLKNNLRVYDDNELKARFIDTINALEVVQDGEKQKHVTYISALMDVMLEKFIDYEKLNKCVENLKKMLNVEIVNIFDIPNSFFSGLHFDDVEATFEIYTNIIDALQAGELEYPIRQFREKIGDIPAAAYFELFYSNLSNNEYKDKLEEYSRKYPDYIMFKIFLYAIDPRFHEQFKTLLTTSNERITTIEFTEFLNSYATYYLPSRTVKIEELVALEDCLQYYHREGIDVEDSMFMTFVIKAEMVKQYYNIADD
jgi:hypothetical protein